MTRYPTIITDEMVERATRAFAGRGQGDWKWEDGIRLALQAALEPTASTFEDAIERAVQALHREEPPEAMSYREIAERVLRAAGETR